MTPDQVGITGITESFKVAKNKGKIPIVAYMEYNNLFNEYRRSAGDPTKKAKLLGELRQLYGKHIYKK